MFLLRKVLAGVVAGLGRRLLTRAARMVVSRLLRR